MRSDDRFGVKLVVGSSVMQGIWLGIRLGGVLGVGRGHVIRSLCALLELPIEV